MTESSDESTTTPDPAPDPTPAPAAEPTPEPALDPVLTDRRGFLSTVVMGAGLVVSHVTALAFAARYLFPVDRKGTQRLFVGLVREMPPGTARAFQTPNGQTINIVHTRDGFAALSDVCPHLGCRVHWSQPQSRFICPCHDGHFDETGAPIAGPPKETGTPLSRFTTSESDGRLFLEVPIRS